MTDKKDTTDITLGKPITIDGASIGTLRMREPTVADQLAQNKVKGDEIEKELSMIANLCQVAPADLQQLTLKDYKKVQAALVAFIE